MHPNRLKIMALPAEAEKQTRISLPTFIYTFSSSLRKNTKKKKVLSVAKIMNSIIYLSFTFGDMKFKKYIIFNYSAGNMDT